MSSGYPPQERYMMQPNQVMMGAPVGAPVQAAAAQQPQQIAAPQPSPQPAAPKHAASLDKLSGLQSREVFLKWTGTPAQFENGAGIQNRATLGRAFVEAMRRTVGLRNRHDAKNSERVGDPTKGVLKKIEICQYMNDSNKDLAVDFDDFMRQAGAANGAPCSFVMPQTRGKIVNDGTVLEEVSNVMTDKMLTFKGLLTGAKYEIIENPDPNATHWSVQAHVKHTDAAGREFFRPSFSLLLLEDELHEGNYERVEPILDGIARAKLNPEVHQLTVPREMLQKVKGDMVQGERDLQDSMTNFYTWGSTINPVDGSSWTDHGSDNGVNVGLDMGRRQAADSAVNGTTMTAWIKAKLYYGMTL